MDCSIVHKVFMSKLKNKAFAVDNSCGVAYVSKTDLIVFINRFLHLEKRFARKFILELCSLGLLERVNQQSYKIFL